MSGSQSTCVQLAWAALEIWANCSSTASELHNVPPTTPPFLDNPRHNFTRQIASIASRNMSAADYYQGGDAPQAGGNQSYGEQAVKETQPPPQYGQQNGYGPQVPQGGWSEKPTFNQAFKLDKPKYNDLWAAIFVRCLGLRRFVYRQAAPPW